jgi:hypothetical protein
MLVSFGSMDTRRRLAAPYNERSRYPGHCLSSSVIDVPLTQVDASSAATQLISTAKVIKQEYARQRAYPALLAVIAEMGDMLVAGMKA